MDCGFYTLLRISNTSCCLGPLPRYTWTDCIGGNLDDGTANAGFVCQDWIRLNVIQCVIHCYSIISGISWICIDIPDCTCTFGTQTCRFTPGGRKATFMMIRRATYAMRHRSYCDRELYDIVYCIFCIFGIFIYTWNILYTEMEGTKNLEHSDNSQDIKIQSLESVDISMLLHRFWPSSIVRMVRGCLVSCKNW